MKNLSRYQRILLLSLTFFVMMITVAVFHEDGIITVYEFQDELVELKKNNEQLKESNIRLRKEIKLLKSDPFSVEKIAREKLQMVKPGETVYKIIPGPRFSDNIP